MEIRAITIPRKQLPTSPNMIADFGKFKSKKPKTDAAILISTKVKLGSARIKYAKIEKIMKINIASSDANPSIPSIKLYKLIIQTI